MTRHLPRLPLLLVLAVLLPGLAACSKADPPPPVLTWNGQALEGARFARRDAEGVTVYYTDRTAQGEVEKLAGVAGSLAQRQVRAGFLTSADRLEVWLVPPGMAWPRGLAPAPPQRQSRAAAPRVVVMAAEALAESTDRGLPEAVAVAATQAAHSPAFAVDWLHEGLGQLFHGGFDQFPVDPYKRLAGVLGQEATGPAIMQRLKQAPGAKVGQERSQQGAGEKEELDAWRNSAAALALLVLDRWGVRFSHHYPRSPAEMAPDAALRWATGAADDAQAARLFSERLEWMARAEPRTGSMADISPVRVEPKPVRGGGNGPMGNYSTHRYRIRARYEPDRRQVTGELDLGWMNGEQREIDTLYFNLWPNSEQYARFGGAIAIEAVEVDNKPAAFEARGLDLVVPLGENLAQGQVTGVKIRFTTTLPARITPRVFGQDEKGLFNLAHWYPILAVLDERGWNLHAMPLFPGEPYSESSDFTVRLDVPAGTVVAATGRPTGRTEQEGRWVYQWQAPNVRDWVAIGGPHLAEETRQVGAVTIRVVDADRDLARTIGAETERALGLFEPRFGPYPYPDLVVAPCCAGLEYPGLFYTAKPSTQNEQWWRTVLYHELAHQWFYGAVGNDQYGEAWLDEGFARYGERLANRSFGYTEQLRNYKTRSFLLSPGVYVNSSSGRFGTSGYAGVVYDQGAWVLEELEALLGEATFRRLLLTWTERYRFRTATTADFVRLAEEVAGRSLTDFFRAHGVEPGVREPYRPLIPLGQVRPK